MEEAVAGPVSDIGILNDPVSLTRNRPSCSAVRDLLLGAILGAAAVARGIASPAAVSGRGGVGFVVWLVGWMVIKDVI